VHRSLRCAVLVLSCAVAAHADDDAYPVVTSDLLRIRTVTV
jgi:hypothetical protein